MKGVNLDEYFTQKRSDGVEGLTIHGVPKSGKSNMAVGLVGHLITNYKENLIIPGDINCEWRHFIHNKSIEEYLILVPENVDIEYFNIPKDVVEFNVLKVDYNNLQIEHFLKNKSNFMLVIYDSHYIGPNFYKRIELWNDVARQLIQRTYSLYDPIIILFHEAGVYFPQISIGKHFEQVYNFSQYMVDFRKSLIRLVLISQLDSEIVNTIWAKNYWTIYRKGYYSKRVPEKIRTNTPFYKIHQYCISYGNLYTPSNIIKKVPEHPDIWKMIPMSTLEVENNSNSNAQFVQGIVERMYERGLKQKEIAYIIERTQQRVSQMLN